MLAQASANLSGVSLVVSIIALLVALFSVPASFKTYLVWIRDVALWLALAFVAAVALKVIYQRAERDGTSMAQAAIDLVSRTSSDATGSEEAE
jgi:hypothetical protein